MTPDEPITHHPLPVLPNSGKVDQLRAEQQDTAGTAKPNAAEPKKLADRTPIDDAVEPNLTDEQRRLRVKVVGVLQSVYDPEIPVNIFDLGLIYAIEVSPDRAVRVRMTLTAPGCPVAGTLPGEIQRKLEAINGVREAIVELVWDPPWDKSRMSEAAMLELGLV